jgi:hypothetical protein
LYGKRRKIKRLQRVEKMILGMHGNAHKRSGFLRSLRLAAPLPLFSVFLLSGLLHARQGPTLQHRADAADKVVIAKEFASGGAVDFKVSSGDIRIVRNQVPGQIRLEIQLQTKGFDTSLAVQKWVRTFVVEGDHASISLQLPSSKTVGLATLYLPEITSMTVDLHAGKLVVRGVKGNKNLHVGNGALTLREADSATYASVKAEVGLGQLVDGVFHGKESGMLGREMEVQGKGKYQLYMHLGAGDLQITQEDGSF